jgi:ankyrin repeat protein
MSSTFYKISCTDKTKECNIIEPISENLDFGGINPITGQKFIKDDVDSIMKRYNSMCLNKDGKNLNCCDPKETRFKVSEELRKQYDNKKYKVNREFGVIKSIETCNTPETCTEPEWQEISPYLMCKIGTNQPDVRNNVMKFNSLIPDCYSESCTIQGGQVSFGQLISGSGKYTESTYISDLRLSDNLKEDNIGAIKTFLDNYQLTVKRTGVDYILSDNDSGDSLLLRAIKFNSLKSVSLLLGNGANVNNRAMDTGMTTLHYACMYGNENMVANLINYGARTDINDFNGRPPLFYAIMYGDLPMVSFLINQNPAMLSVKDKEGNSALHIAMKYSKNVSNVVKFLLDNGLSSEDKNNAGLKPAHIGNKRISDLQKTELENNTEMFLEPFETLAKAVENKQPESEVVSSVNSAISMLRKSHVNENQNLYKGFITPQNNLEGPVNFNKYACFPNSNIENQTECEKEGGKWQQYEDENMKTFAKVDYTDQPDDSYYYNVNITPVPVKELQPLDHDSIMKTESTSTPSSTSTPTSTPSSTSTPTPTSTSISEDFTDNDNVKLMGLNFNGNKYIIIGAFITFFIILIVLLYLISKNTC